jgi:hypothetical protein
MTEPRLTLPDLLLGLLFTGLVALNWIRGDVAGTVASSAFLLAHEIRLAAKGVRL